MSLMYAGKPRSPYAGMSESELDAELAIGDIESAAKKLESAVKAVESEADDLEDEVVDAKVDAIHGNLIAKYGSRDLTLPEMMYELNYNQHKAKDFLQVIGKATVSNVAMMIVRDANDETIRDDNFNRLLDYLTERYKAYIGCPIENLELETGIDHKIALPIAKKMMGLHPKSVVKFIPVDVIAKIIFEDI